MPSIIILGPFTSSVFDVPQELKWIYLNSLMILAPVREVTQCPHFPLPVLLTLVSSLCCLKKVFFHKVWRCSREAWIPSLENHSYHEEREPFLKGNLWVGKRSRVWKEFLKKISFVKNPVIWTDCILPVSFTQKFSAVYLPPVAELQQNSTLSWPSSRHIPKPAGVNGVSYLCFICVRILQRHK